MKKKTKMIIGGTVAFFVLGILSGLSTQSSATGTSTDTPVVAEVEEDKNPLMEARTHEAPVMNGAGTEAIGQYLYIEVKKDELTSLTQEEFKEFADEVVKDSGYNYVTIIAVDASKAIFFPGSMVEMAQYGIINIDGTIKNVFGDIVLQEDGTYQYTAR